MSALGVTRFEPILTFDGAFAPISRDQFLQQYWNRSFLVIPGHPGKFADLLPWSELNLILEQHRLAPPRLRLIKDGKDIPSSRFMDSSGPDPRVSPAAFASCLADGATLILNEMEDLAPRIRDLADEFQRVLRSFVQVNLYAAWRIEKGFDLHWDDQDTMIVQVFGRKHWKVYPPTRLYPVKPNDPCVGKDPTGEPVWEGVLEDGDALYMPRGWWHAAVPMDEATLHLTYTIVPHRGVDLLNWFVRELLRHEIVRMDLPRLAGAEEQRSYVAKLRQVVTESLTDDVMTRFLADAEAERELRPEFHLPLAPTQQGAPMTARTRIRLATVNKLSFQPLDDGTKALFWGNQQRWECAPEIVPALAALSGSADITIEELCAKLPSRREATQLKIMLGALAMAGVVWVDSSADLVAES